jgi:hypothetical protein
MSDSESCEANSPTQRQGWIIEGGRSKQPWCPIVEMIDGDDYIRISKQDKGFALFAGVHLSQKGLSRKEMWTNVNFVDKMIELRNRVVADKLKDASHRALQSTGDPYLDAVEGGPQKKRREAVDDVEKVVEITMPQVGGLPEHDMKVATSPCKHCCVRVERTDGNIKYLSEAAAYKFDLESTPGDGALDIDDLGLSDKIKVSKTNVGMTLRIRYTCKTTHKYKYLTRTISNVVQDEATRSMLVRTFSDELLDKYNKLNDFGATTE